MTNHFSHYKLLGRQNLQRLQRDERLEHCRSQVYDRVVTQPPGIETIFMEHIAHTHIKKRLRSYSLLVELFKSEFYLQDIK